MTTMMYLAAATVAIVVCSPALGFVVPPQTISSSSSHAHSSANQQTSLTALDAVGIFFGTSTGSTEEVADLIKGEFGDDAEGPFDIETLEGPVKQTFEKFDALIVGSESSGGSVFRRLSFFCDW